MILDRKNNLADGFKLLGASYEDMDWIEPTDYSDLYQEEYAEYGMKIIDYHSNREWFSKGGV